MEAGSPSNRSHVATCICARGGMTRRSATGEEPMRHRFLLGAAAALAVTAAAVASAAPPNADVRFATFNASLNRPTAGLLTTHLANPNVDDQFRRQAKNVAEVVQRIAPDVLLVNEFDPLDNADAPAGPEELLRDNFLEVSQSGATPIEYPYAFIAPSNTGVATGKDLNNNGVAVTTPGALGYGDDAFGFGAFPGQFGMVVLLEVPDPGRPGTDLSALQVEGHAREPDPDPVLRPGRGRDPAALVQEPLGRADPDRAGRSCTSSSRIRRRPCSTGQRIGTAAGTTTRSGSGRTTSHPASRATSTTTKESAAA